MAFKLKLFLNNHHVIYHGKDYFLNILTNSEQIKTTELNFYIVF